MRRHEGTVLKHAGQHVNVRLPRLTGVKAQAIIEARGLLSLDALEEIQLPDLQTEQFAPTGPPRVSPEYLLSLRTRLGELATAAGYPE